jgi:hypothetical protein
LRKLYSNIPVSIHGHDIVPIDLNLNTKIAESFYKNILDLNIYDISKARSSIIFTGGRTHVLSVTTAKEAIYIVNNNINYIAYISDTISLPLNISVIFNDAKEIFIQKDTNSRISNNHSRFSIKKNNNKNVVLYELIQRCADSCSTKDLDRLSSMLV